MSTAASFKGDDGWTRLRSYLTALQVGDRITVDDTSTETHLAPEKVLLVLQALVRAGLFERHDDSFVRCHLDWK
jgi:hypothetical protein